MAQAVPTQQVDDERVRVTRWDFAPGANTGFHVHEYPYVVTYLTDAQLRIVDKDENESGNHDRAARERQGKCQELAGDV